MFPDSILTTENKNIITDISYTNSIHKIYVCTMGVEVLQYGDIIVLYRTAEYGRSAEYSAVATSICIVEEVRRQDEFATFEEFFEMLTLKQLGRHAKPMAVLNTQDYYTPMRRMLLHSVEGGFMSESCMELFGFCAEPAEALEYLRSAKSITGSIKRLADYNK